MQQISQFLVAQPPSLHARLCKHLKQPGMLWHALPYRGETFPGHLHVFRDGARCPWALLQAIFPFAFPLHLPLRVLLASLLLHDGDV